MARDTAPRKRRLSDPHPTRPVRRARTTEELVERLLTARTANEIAAVAGLPPITGLSGPKIAY